MTTNVIDAIREKDKTLQEVIDYCTNWKNALYNDREGSHENLVQADALTRVICKCESMLGSGSMPSCLTYEDWDDSSEDNQPQVGDYGVAVRGTEDGPEEIPFHIEREERIGLPVALMNVGLYAKPEDDIADGEYASLFQLYLDGYVLSRTGRKRNENE
ncbi:hypothetical protein [Bifidobacterium pseudocatenulatum]|uniref:hypothetical protein n=1 Tax=Bifidobacterium pseudocatenulatum TaxID=28026 RepID=UPI000E4B2740|nr:hypothetical protein [Bifidobacterium pseudocatenulatum]RHJ35042.1 hypothetical protein DW131_01820 [Bifidobacterium pseudocatenulatum]